MLLWENIVLAINSLLSNKMRAILTMLGIIIGIGSVIAIITVGDSLTLSVSESMQSMGANDVYVMVEQRNQEDEISSKYDGAKFGQYSFSATMTEDDYLTEDMIKELCSKFEDEIYAINLQYSIGNGEVPNGSNSASVTASGVSAGYFVTNELTMLGGRMFSQEEFEEGKNTVIVSDKLVNKLFDGDIKKALGTEIELSVNDQNASYTIVGVYEYQANYMMGMSLGSGDDVTTSLYMPLKAGLSFDHSKAVYPYIQIITKVGVDADELAAKIENFFEPYYRTNRNCEVTAITMGSMVSMLTDMLSTITLAISIVAGIALVVGGIGVMNIMLVSITERTREIGTRKALGAKNSSIRVQFIVEAVIICLIGGIIGVILGIGGGILASNILGYPAHPSISGIIVSLLFSMSIGVFFGYYPANKAAKMNPIDALRYE
jgi:putative ABC transport system permease protein